ASSASMISNPNQTELDAGELVVNGSGSSDAAEICYFLRNGNLYRRQLLIREPLPVVGQELEAQPSSNDGQDLFSGVTDYTDPANTFDGQFQIVGSASPTDDFLRYFDYSAYPDFHRVDPNDNTSAIVQTTGFVSWDALSNENSSVAGGAVGPLVSLGKPVYRFGFDFSDGLSREHLSAPNGGPAVGFMGRFLHAETSAPNFNYPQRLTYQEGTTTVLNQGNPYNIDNIGFSTNNYGVITQFDGTTGRGGARAQEDILLANVREMRIEVWDERRAEFVTPGYGTFDSANGTVTGVNGDFHVARNLNTAFGPDNRLSGAVFDTWHPDNTAEPIRASLGAPFLATPFQFTRAPYELYVYTPPYIAEGGTTASVIPKESGNAGYWKAGTYSVGQIVFPFNDLSDASGIPGANGQFDVGGTSLDTIHNWGYQVAFRCIDVTGTGTTGPTQPTWTSTHGRRVTDNEVIWQTIDNRRSLRAIRMAIRFLNEKTNELRQLTLVLPLTDE
ncbi:MAG: hypothetical protein KDA89_23015, partial [Planctomycetaceae bacterium]|nr:hypothetical protein [Planctomycetaceae bacterium]